MGGVGDFFKKIGKEVQNFYNDLTGKNQRKKIQEQGQQIQSQIDAATQAQLQASREGLQAYKDIFSQGLVSSQLQNLQSLASSLAGGQLSADVLRNLTNQDLALSIPDRMAKLSLQGSSIPALQQALGLPAYNLPTSLQFAYLPPPTLLSDFATNLNALSGLLPSAPGPTSPGGSSAGTAGGTGTPSGGAALPPGIRAAHAGSIRLPPGSQGTGGSTAVGHPIGSNPTATASSSPFTGTQTSELTPYSGPAFNFQSSPAYQFQLDELNRALTNQVAAKGISPEAATQIQSRGVQALAAQERDKVISNLMSLAGVSVQAQTPALSATGQQLGQTVAQSGASTADILNRSAQSRAGLYGNYATGVASGYAAQGAARGQGALTSAQLGGSLANAYGQTGNPLVGLLGRAAGAYVGNPSGFRQGLYDLGSAFGLGY